MQIKTISGTVNATGKKVGDNDADCYDFIELKLKDGSYAKLTSAIVANDCSRGLRLGDDVTMVYCDNPDAKSKIFTSNVGVSTVYAMYSTDGNRVFDDTNMLNDFALKLDKSLKFLRFMVWGFVAFLAVGANNDPNAFWLFVFGLIIPLGFHFLMYKPVKRLRAMSATKAQMEPFLQSLRALVKPAATSPVAA